MGSITGGGSQGATIPAGKGSQEKRYMFVLQENDQDRSGLSQIEGLSFCGCGRMYCQRIKVEILTCARGEGGDARRNREHVRGDIRV
jgi:hypothetical protein